jgi:hypothetical protein
MATREGTDGPGHLPLVPAAAEAESAERVLLHPGWDAGGLGASSFPSGPQGERDYLSYLLRVWRVNNDSDGPVWRASLESPVQGELLRFASLEEAFLHLRAEIGTAQDSAASWTSRDSRESSDGRGAERSRGRQGRQE